MVIVYVSRQDKDKTQPVPSLTGRMLEDARNEIKGKFSVRVVEQASEQPAGTVLSQSPAAGSEAASHRLSRWWSPPVCLKSSKRRRIPATAMKVTALLKKAGGPAQTVHTRFTS